MELLFPLAAFVVALLASARSLGWGLAAVVAVGYLNGVVRANFLGVASTFMFDAGLLGLYAGLFAFHGRQVGPLVRSTAGVFVLLLTAWPALLAVIPVNDYLVQLVALRGTVWFLPVVLAAARMTDADLSALARTLGVMNLVALAVAVYEYQYGIEAVFPKNAVTLLMYRSGDVAGFTAFRIPSTFLNAHSYGGTMLATLPFLLDRLFGRGAGVFDRTLSACGVAAAGAGLLLCAARSPLVMLGLAVVVAWVCSRFSVWVGLAAGVLVAAGVGLASTSERLQRAATLEDTEFVSQRVGGSWNAELLDILIGYPFGAGMGSSKGTSLPDFLADRGPKQIGLENEFSRITVDQGWVGLGLWLAFLGWLVVRVPAAEFGVPWHLGRVLMYAVVLSSWGTAFIGTGLLASVPASVLLLVMMGVLAKPHAANTPEVP